MEWRNESFSCHHQLFQEKKRNVRRKTSSHFPSQTSELEDSERFIKWGIRNLRMFMLLKSLTKQRSLRTILSNRLSLKSKSCINSITNMLWNFTTTLKTMIISIWFFSSVEKVNFINWLRKKEN